MDLLARALFDTEAYLLEAHAMLDKANVPHRYRRFDLAELKKSWAARSDEDVHG